GTQRSIKLSYGCMKCKRKYITYLRECYHFLLRLARVRQKMLFNQSHYQFASARFLGAGKYLGLAFSLCLSRAVCSISSTRWACSLLIPTRATPVAWLVSPLPCIK